MIRLAAEDNSTVNSSISDKVRKLVEGFLYLGDRVEVRYLQTHLKKVYAHEIRYALDSTDQDFSNRVREAEKKKDSYERDQDLVAIIEQQVKKQQLVGASATIARVHNASSRVGLLADLAAAQHQAGDEAEAKRSLESAIHACFEPAEGVIFVDPPDRQLEMLASSLATQSYDAGARRALSEARNAIISKSASASIEWYNFAETAISVNDMQSAEAALQQVSDEHERQWLQQRMTIARAKEADGDARVRLAAQISDPETRARLLCELVNQQVSAGSNGGVAAMIERAQEAAVQVDDVYRVRVLIDIAWAQIDVQDWASAERTFEQALEENEKTPTLVDRVEAWVSLAETAAFLGHPDRAQQIAARIDDPYTRGTALALIAQREVESGHVNEALAWASLLKDPDERSASYVSIAETLLEQLKNAEKR